ncbi:hypothetical protein WDW37_06205 [Bdellovibrionota bacterium FG-1]
MAIGKNEADLLSWVASKKDGLTNDQFLRLVSMVSNRLERDYDEKRAASAFGAQGAVSGDSLLSAAHRNSMLGDEQIAAHSGLPNPTGDLQDFEGVCRDIAVLQAKMLKARGFKNTFVISWASRLGLHTTVITQDPVRPNQLYQFNYKRLAGVSDKDGSVALHQGNWDATMNYRISTPEGRSLTDVPSEMGKFVAEAASFNITHLDPLARASSSMIGAGTRAGENGAIGARLVTGQDAVGSRYLVTALDAKWGDQSGAPGKVGLVAGIQDRPKQVYQTDNDELARLIYLQTEQHLTTTPIKVGKGVTVEVDSSATLMAGIVSVMNGKDAIAPSFSLRQGTEVRVNQRSSDGKYHGTYKAGVQLDPLGISDIRNIGQFGKVWSPSFSSAYGGVSATYKVDPALTLMADVTLVVSQLSARAKIEAGVTGEIPLEGDVLAGTRVMGNMNVTF